MKKIYKFLKLIWEGKSISDKVLISFYLIKNSFTKNLKINNKLRIKNKYGEYICGETFDEVWIASSFHEPHVYKELIKKEFDIFIDVGANIGRHGISYAKTYPLSKIFCFEAEQKNFNILRKNIKINNLNNTIPVFKAVSERNGFVNFYVAPFSGGGHSLNRKIGRETKIRSISLDGFFKKDKGFFKKKILVKIDVEGAEIKVLTGMKKMISRNMLKIVFESHNKDHLLEIKKFLDEFGYKIKRIGKIDYVAEKN